MTVTWSQVNGAAGYLLQRSTDAVNWMQVASIAGSNSSFQDGGVVSNSTYYYRVAASNSGGMSSFSAAAGVVTPALVLPAAPSNLIASRVSKGKIRLTWSDNSTDETSFRIEYSTNGTSWNLLSTVSAGTTSYTAGGLHRGTVYSFRICACNAAGNSSYCLIAKATAAKTVASTIAPPPTGAAPFSAARVSVLDLKSDDPSALKSKRAKVFQAT